MIVDTSAVVALIAKEPESAGMLDVLENSRLSPRMSAASFFEAGIVLDSPRHEGLAAELETLLQTIAISVEPVTLAQARIARDAYRRYGKGSGHPANLNFGDCFTYALAYETGEPLLFKGNDFSQTDIESALG